MEDDDDEMQACEFLAFSWKNYRCISIKKTDKNFYKVEQKY